MKIRAVMGFPSPSQVPPCTEPEAPAPDKPPCPPKPGLLSYLSRVRRALSFHYPGRPSGLPSIPPGATA